MSYFLKIPEQIKISLTNVCNYKCTMCPNRYIKQKKGYITDELLNKILDESAELGIKQISLGGTGEPLAHKNFLKYLKRAKDLGFVVSTTSNCSLLNRDFVDRILYEGLDRFCVSIYSSDAQSHRNYTGTDLFLKASENIKYLLKRWREVDSKMQINMWFLSIPGINDQEKFLEYWGPIAKEVGLELSIKQPINWAGKIDIYGAGISKPMFYLRDGEKGYEIVNKRKIRCGHVRSYLFILHDGIVVPCCNIQESDPEGKIAFGNIVHDRILDVWQSQKYKNFKTAHFSKTISHYPLCKDCSEVISEVTWQLNPRYYFGKVNRLLKK